MEMTQPANRIHPLMAGAAISVILVSLLGAAALTGILPNVHASASPTAPVAAQAPVVAPPSALAQQVTPPVVASPQDHGEDAAHRTVVHQYPVRHAQAPLGSPSYAQASTYPQSPQQAPTTQTAAYSQVPSAAQQPAPARQYNPIGIGVGAVVGGLLGNQVGNGNGKTLATIAGALGGGYLGNEIANRTP
jgi:uncharacterized protein YcfJ